MTKTVSNNIPNSLRLDAECLLKSSNSIIRKMRWNWSTPIREWKGVCVGENSRIIQLNMSTNTEYDLLRAQRLVLPPKLESLYMDAVVVELSNLQLPAELEYLNLQFINLRPEAASSLVLPSRLQSLSLTHNNINALCVKKLVLPPGLQELDLSNNTIGDDGVKGLIFPSGASNSKFEQ